MSPPGAELVIRPLEGHAEREACVALQDEIWGPGFSDRVPASILMVAAETGGVVSGAFDGDRLAGFVFGITGLRNGRLLHWSDMLAVRPGYRGRGLGVALKRHQRALLLERGVEHACWTFDPLVARNAHLNLNRLGATAGEYRRDLYGDSDSPLHAGLGTDRLVAEWALASDRVRRRLDSDPSPAPAPPPSPGGAAPPRLVNPASVPAGGGHPRPSGAVLGPHDVDGGAGDVMGIAVPSDLQALRADDPDLARAWRLNVREAFERWLPAGYAAVALQRRDRVAVYVLERAFAR